jgi:isopenicillin-N N-acyltransferase-like protein
VEDLQRMLRDESDGLLSICRKPDLSLPPEAQLETVASVVMELDRGVMHVAPDVPSRADYRPLGLVSEGEVALA